MRKVRLFSNCRKPRAAWQNNWPSSLASNRARAAKAKMAKPTKAAQIHLAVQLEAGQAAAYRFQISVTCSAPAQSRMSFAAEQATVPARQSSGIIWNGY